MLVVDLNLDKEILQELLTKYEASAYKRGIIFLWDCYRIGVRRK